MGILGMNAMLRSTAPCWESLPVSLPLAGICHCWNAGVAHDMGPEPRLPLALHSRGAVSQAAMAQSHCSLMPTPT